jgi:hypothetical protein
MWIFSQKTLLLSALRTDIAKKYARESQTYLLLSIIRRTLVENRLDI